MKIKILLSFLFVYCFSKAQTNIDLKNFINENHVAICSVQKNMLRENNTNYASSFKELLKNQEAAVKLYNSDNESSSYFAAIVRKECLTFLKAHTQSNLDYLEITSSEKSFIKESKKDYSKVLSASEIKAIDKQDVMNTQNLNSPSLTIQ